MTGVDAVGGATRSGTPRASWVVVGLVAVLPMLLVLLATADGVGVSADSTQYLFVANSLVRGEGLMTLWWNGHPEPLTHFPPGYPAALASLGGIAGGPLAAARLLNALLVAANVGLVAVLARQAAPANPGIRAAVTVSAAVMAAVATDLAIAGSMAWSETPFITLLLLTLITLDPALRPGTRALPATLFVAALCAGLATLMRYTGIALIAAGALTLFALSPTTWRTRTLRAFVFGALGAVPFIFWSLYNIGRSGSASNREITMHVISMSELRNGALTVSGWFVPYVGSAAPRAVALLVLGTVGAWSLAVVLRRASAWERDSATHASEALGSAKLFMFPLTYAAFLVLSISLADKSTGLDPRILAPALPVVLAAFAAVAGELFMPGRATRALRHAVLAAGGVYVMAQVAGVATWIESARRDGLGLVRAQRAAPGFMARVVALPSTARVYSNMPYLLNYLTGRSTAGFPWRHSPTSLRRNANVRDQWQAMAPVIGDSLVYLVEFDVGREIDYVSGVTDAAEALQLTKVESGIGGTIAQVTGRR